MKAQDVLAHHVMHGGPPMIKTFLIASETTPAMVCRTEPAVVMDWSAGSPPQTPPDPPAVGIGRYLEDRAVYTSSVVYAQSLRKARVASVGPSGVYSMPIAPAYPDACMSWSGSPPPRALWYASNSIRTLV